LDQRGHLESVEVGQHQVEQHQRWALLAHQPEAVHAVDRTQRAKAERLHHAHHLVAAGLDIVDDEDGGRHFCITISSASSDPRSGDGGTGSPAAMRFTIAYVWASMVTSVKPPPVGTVTRWSGASSGGGSSSGGESSHSATAGIRPTSNR